MVQQKQTNAVKYFISWRRHQMETFSALLTICAGNSPVPGEFPTQRPVTWSFDVFFDLRLNKRLSKQSWGWWFETLSRPLWRHCNVHLLLGTVEPHETNTVSYLSWQLLGLSYHVFHPSLCDVQMQRDILDIDSWYVKHNTTWSVTRTMERVATYLTHFLTDWYLVHIRRNNTMDSHRL